MTEATARPFGRAAEIWTDADAGAESGAIGLHVVGLGLVAFKRAVAIWAHVCVEVLPTHFSFTFVLCNCTQWHG